MITFDLETRSEADLKKVGAWCYSRDATTDIICGCWGIEDNEIQEWWPGRDKTNHMPKDLREALGDGVPIEAHNVAFERSIWMNVLATDFGWEIPDAKQWRDTMAVAAYYAMPMALDKLARVLGFPGKDPEGGRLISRYSKLHLKTAKRVIPPEDFRKFVDYCRWDVALEQAVSDELGDLPEPELEAFHLDQEINLRGLGLNEASIRDAMAIVEDRAEILRSDFWDITGCNPTQHAKVMEWFEAQDVPLDSLQKDYIDEVLGNKLNIRVEGTVRRALEIRRSHARASTKKLASMLRNRDPWDGRARFQTRYHGASTGRWTGTGFQPLNLSKGFEHVPPSQLVTDLSHRSALWLDIMYGDAMEAVGKASRHHIVAGGDSRLLAGDFVSIEAVLLSCLAGEEWKVDAFRNREPIYELMGCEIHRLGPEAERLARDDKGAFKNKFPGERFDGKTGELAFGYQGALGAWRKFDPETSSKHSDERVVEICKAWRDKHPAIVAFWRGLEKAALRAVRKGTAEGYRDIEFEIIDEWLSMRLPNGKRIWYFKPELRLGMPPWHRPEDKEDCADGTCNCEPMHKLTYMAQKEGQWRRVYTYGGKLAENGTQGLSREVLVPAMLRLRDAGYNIILSVYDEIVSEVRNGFGSVQEYTDIMLESAGEFADSYPISVDVWEGPVYKK